MNKKIRLSAMVVACALVFMGMAVSPASAIDIKLTGYCDGMNLNIVSGSIVWGHRTGCAAQALSGDYCLILAPRKGAAIVASFWNGVNQFNYYIYLDGKWENWYTNGTSPMVKMNSGTWTLGVPAAAEQAERCSSDVE